MENNIKKVDSTKGIFHTPKDKLHLNNKNNNVKSLNKKK
jgi:hypothetical protein